MYLAREGKNILTAWHAMYKVECILGVQGTRESWAIKKYGLTRIKLMNLILEDCSGWLSTK